MSADLAPAAGRSGERQGGTAVGLMPILLALLAAIAAATAILGQATSGAQPWSNELSDNFIFAKSLAFTIAVGVTVGLFRARAASAAVLGIDPATARRFSPGTAIGHWTMAVGFLLALPTGLWQYLGGILDVAAPIPLYWFYRVHYVGATLILFSVANFATYWWLSADRPLLVPRGEWAGQLRGLVDELPRALGARLAKLLRVDMKRAAPDPGAFAFYEKVVSLPLWVVAITLITVTGLIKASRYIVPIPGGVLYWASTFHVAAMVLIGIALLDHLRYNFAHWPGVVAMATTRLGGGHRRIRGVVALLGLIWALGGALVAYLFVANAFVAKTAAKEGILAQLALLVGGTLTAVFALALILLCVRIARRDLASG